MNTRKKISAFVICKNEESSIERCLRSLEWCDEIVVVDSGSTDRTLEICRRFSMVRIIEQDWLGHRLQKQFALQECQYEWILNLDSDEELSMTARQEILRILREGSEHDGYYIRRLVYFFNRWWDKGGWHPEYRMRFFRKEKTKWGGIDPHEKALVEGSLGKLKGFIYHYSFNDISDFLNMQNSFSSRTAELLYAKGERSSLEKLIVRPLGRFFKFYLFKLGFREGLAGFLMAVAEGHGAFLKYFKLWELEERKAKK